MIYLPAAGGAFFLLDQWSKRVILARSADPSISFGPFWIRRVIYAKPWFQRAGMRGILVLLWFMSLACASALFRRGIWFQSPLALSGLALAFGGAAGNLADILRRRFVVDFVDLRWWPVFNLADIGIVGGLALALFC